MKNSYNYYLSICVFASLASCTKIIEVDLNTKNPQLIIEGKISNEAGPYSVVITKSVNFSETNNFPPVTNATVIITDGLGTIDTLIQANPGEYKTSKIVGTPGKTYNLAVFVDGKKYESVSKMPTFIEIDSLYATKNPLNIGDELKSVSVPIITDQSGVVNFYRYIEYVNGKKVPDLYLFDDKFFDGIKVENELYNRDSKRKKNDTITVEMLCVDKPNFEYLLSIPFPGTAVLANPNSNISGGCLGYFSAYTVSRKKIVVQ